MQGPIALFRSWKAKRRAKAEKLRVWLSEFEDFVSATEPLTPRAPSYPTAALFRQVWKRSVAFGWLATHANQAEDAEKFQQFSWWASSRYNAVAPSNLYGKVRLKMTRQMLELLVEDELARQAAEEERLSWERSGRFRGVVYLLESGGDYKIGMTTNMKKRASQMKTLLPNPVTEVHMIRTNSPRAVERYWHDRFSSKRKKGEWFALDESDIAEFRGYSVMSMRGETVVQVPQAPRPRVRLAGEALTKFVKVVELEMRRGCDNGAVVGGMDLFFENARQDDGVATLLDSATLLIPYREMSSEKRETWLQELLAEAWSQFGEPWPEEVVVAREAAERHADWGSEDDEEEEDKF